MLKSSNVKILFNLFIIGLHSVASTHPDLSFIFTLYQSSLAGINPSTMSSCRDKFDVELVEVVVVGAEG